MKLRKIYQRVGGLARRRAWRVIREVPDGAMPEDLGYTIGSSIVFPGFRVDGKATIKGARGFHPRIADRFDLTLECIRRYYVGQDSPLANALLRYGEFFALFDDFIKSRNRRISTHVASQLPDL